MKGDFSRDTFDPGKHFSRVLMQQGRVQLDADWNEQNAIFLHYLRTLAKDLLGPHAGPADSREQGFEILFLPKETTPDTKADIEKKIKNFEPSGTRQNSLIEALNKQNIVIGPGRYYVEGILVENDRAILYTEQLGIDSENQLPLQEIQDCQKDHDLLFYLDVWERHISYVEDEDIREVALGGPDTCSRSKVVWQVKALLGNSLTCNSLGDDSHGKCGLPLLGNGKLRARARRDDPDADQLCVISPESRYRGSENQLYRVEVHKGGRTNDNETGATFKWSRDNGSVTFPIRKVAGTTVTLEHVGRDCHLGLKSGDWVEFMDERIAMGKYAGPLAKVEIIDRSELSIAVSFPNETVLPSYTEAEIENLYPFLRRWDHAGDVATFGGALQIIESDTTTSRSEAGWVELEDGVQIQFVKNKGEGTEYRVGDYWLIPARVAIGEIEWPDELEPNGKPKRDDDNNLIPAALQPHGPRHYYAPLFLSAAETEDCRCIIKGEPCAPGSATASAFGSALRKGWLRLPFQSIPIPQDNTPPPPPPYRVGVTEARAHKDFDGKTNTKGAGGTMAIPLPPGASHIHRLRVAGQENEKKMKITLFRGGWDAVKQKHVGSREYAVNKLIEEEIGSGAYDKTYEIKEGDLDAECSTLSLEIQSTGYSTVSLVAVEVSMGE
jgi:hypothetical protein